MRVLCAGVVVSSVLCHSGGDPGQAGEEVEGEGGVPEK